MTSQPNRASWNARSAEYQATHGPQLNTKSLAWGAFAVPEAALGALGDVRGQRVLELGCGAAQWTMALADGGALPVGLDVSEEQLAAAVALMTTRLPLVQAAAEAVPFADASFDLVMCDHGGMTWADPFVTVPEVARLLRRGGRLVFNAATPWIYVCWDSATRGVSDRLHIDYFGLHADTASDGSTDYALPYGEWVRLFRANGFVVEDLIEIQPPEGATTTYEYFLRYEWARRWPGEQIWVVRKA